MQECRRTTDLVYSTFCNHDLESVWRLAPEQWQHLTQFKQKEVVRYLLKTTRNSSLFDAGVVVRHLLGPPFFVMEHANCREAVALAILSAAYDNAPSILDALKTHLGTDLDVFLRENIPACDRPASVGRRAIAWAIDGLSFDVLRWLSASGMTVRDAIVGARIAYLADNLQNPDIQKELSKFPSDDTFACSERESVSTARKSKGTSVRGCDSEFFERASLGQDTTTQNARVLDSVAQRTRSHFVML